jgi:hypothetical protein
MLIVHRFEEWDSHVNGPMLVHPGGQCLDAIALTLGAARQAVRHWPGMHHATTCAVWGWS